MPNTQRKMNYYSSTLKLFCFFIPIFLCFASPVVSQPIFLYNYCYDNGNYTNDSAYQTNLNNLFTTINSNTQIDYGFYNFSSDGSSDRAHAIALCRGDITLVDCRRCLNESTHKLTQVCPYQKEAVGWYDKCMLRYSNSSNIFGAYISTPAFFMLNTQNVTNTTEFGVVLGELMVNLSSIASSGDSRRKFATGEVSLTNLEKIYGLVQCTPDLSSSGCSTCIEESVKGIQGCCNTRIGARFVTPSCNVRYEIYNFFEPVVAAPASPPSISLPPPPPETMVETNTTNSSSGSGRKKALRMIIISVVSMIINVVFSPA